MAKRNAFDLDAFDVSNADTEQKKTIIPEAKKEIKRKQKKTENVSFVIDKELKAKLVEYCEEHDVPQSQVFRTLLEDLLN